MENCYQKCEDFEGEREKAQIDLRQELSTRKIFGLKYFDMVKRENLCKKRKLRKLKENKL